MLLLKKELKEMLHGWRVSIRRSRKRNSGRSTAIWSLMMRDMSLNTLNRTSQNS
jgi:hypothetical protein